MGLHSGQFEGWEPVGGAMMEKDESLIRGWKPSELSVASVCQQIV